MHSRRAIRESAIQFLYCSDLEGGAAAEELSDTYWDLSLESDQNKLVKASAKAALHLNQGREARHSKLVERADTALATISADPEAEKLKLALNEILKLESKWQSIIDRIQRLYDPGVETPSPELTSSLKELYTLNTQLTESRKRWNYHLQDFPILNKRLDPIKAAINGLQRVSDRIRMVEHPEQFADHPDIKHLQETADKMASFRQEVDTLTRGIIQQKSKLDDAIHQVVENYRPDRIDPVDRAALRLGTYEILFKEDIPAPVTINECIEISRRFGSSESPKFINGVLDKIAKIPS
ncbi:transcription antitermination factor NusB [Rubritalea tangerina]|uniref:Transcription antitermination protein NusB n=2 Tax=Rubritalea tangerina TaxID=430798 RepID=A0ABW4Z7T4_9BACT